MSTETSEVASTVLDDELNGVGDTQGCFAYIGQRQRGGSSYLRTFVTQDSQAPIKGSCVVPCRKRPLA